MKYRKPQVVAKNRPTGKFAAGCPAKSTTGPGWCKQCERSR